MAICLGSFTVANAQYEPEKGDFAVELGFSPFKTDGGTFKLNEGMLKARWFFSDKNALRLKLGLGIDNSTNTVDNSFDPIDKKGATSWDGETKTKDKSTDFSIMLGYERHLFTEGRFDVYAGLEVGYGLTKYSGTETIDRTTKNFDGNGDLDNYTTYNKSTDFTNQSTDGLSTSSNAFSANIFTGVDVYVWKNLYLGAELVLAFKTGKSPNVYSSYDEKRVAYNKSGDVTGTITSTFNGETNTQVDVVTAGGTTTTTTTVGPKLSNETTNTSFKLYVEPAIRIGWKF